MYLQKKKMKKKCAETMMKPKKINKYHRFDSIELSKLEQFKFITYFI